MSGRFGRPSDTFAASRSSFLFYQKSRELSGSPSLCQKFMAAKFETSKDLFRKDLRGHYGCVNAIEFSNNGGQFVVSGGDDRRILVWNVEKSLLARKHTPTQMKGQHRSNIFCTVFDMDNSHVFSAGNDDQVMRHDLRTRETMGIFLHDDPVYNISIHPEDNVFLTACENGKVLMWDVRTASGSSPSQCIARYPSAAFHAAVFNPVDPVLIATANAKKGVQLWDSRAPKKLLHQYSTLSPQTCAMGVKWNRSGTMLTALRRRLPPVLYRIDHTPSLVEFDHQGYNNVCTMKSHCFAGDNDQYIISGSDDFNVYVWAIPDIPDKPEGVLSVDKAFLVLSGHRSIVNQVRFNPATHMIISAGVEKVIKVWSPWQLYKEKKETDYRPQTFVQRRELYSHEDYVDLVLSSGRPLTHEYDEGSVDEDPRMLAFFDSLIQHEERGWDSDSDESFSPEEFYLNFARGESGSSDSSEGESRGVSIDTVRNIIAGYSAPSREGQEVELGGGREEDAETRAVLRRMGQIRRAMFLRAEAEAEEAGDEDDSEAREVLRRMRHLRRAMFLRGFLRAEALGDAAANDNDEAAAAAAAPSELQYLRDIERVRIQDEVESCSDSSSVTTSGSETRGRLASPEPDLEGSPVRFRQRTHRNTRRYRGRRSRSRSSSSGRSRSNTSTASSSTGGVAQRRHHSGSSSSADGSESGDETRRRRRRRRERMKAQQGNGTEVTPTGTQQGNGTEATPTSSAVSGEQSGICWTATETTASNVDIFTDNIAQDREALGVSNGAECSVTSGEEDLSHITSGAFDTIGDTLHTRYDSSDRNELHSAPNSSETYNNRTLTCCNTTCGIPEKKEHSVVPSGVSRTLENQNNLPRNPAHVNNQSDAMSNDCVTCNARTSRDTRRNESQRVGSNTVLEDCPARNGSSNTDDSKDSGHRSCCAVEPR